MDTHHSGYPRNEHDFYIEDDWCFDALIAVMGRSDFEAGIYDPACGIGTILAGAERFGLRGIGSDIVDHRPLDGPFQLTFKFAGLRNFLTEGERPGVWPSMVFNPPYGKAQAFIEKALHEVKPGGVVAALLPASFRYSQERYEFFNRPEIERIISISKRPSMPDGDALIAGTVKRGGGKTNYDWMVFRAGGRSAAHPPNHWWMPSRAGAAVDIVGEDEADAEIGDAVEIDA